MPTPTNQDIENALREAAVAPLKASGDSGSVEERSAEDLIALDRHLASKSAAKRPFAGLRTTVCRPPGAC